ncbi:flagellar hook-basal body complex protein FliE [Vibrio algivorus]|uniref:Flagellar hook-basal body complex protein FliE n=1 Tax=Vibrio algivorus TaxID=1667024 RepID=A0A557P2P6_9VIBR|nr:flagellar hook-basal body complex protein FliE [Vibrio algivorus]TVO34930.1 flagellar hook-basal body complex protein FliE [Vibrio algivorus]
MNINAIGAIENSMLDRIQQNNTITTNPFNNFTVNSEVVVGKTSSLAFGSTMKSVFDNVNAYQKDAEHKITAVELGQSDDMIGATVAAQKAQLSFTALMQVRNKMVSNFNDIIKMSI